MADAFYKPSETCQVPDLAAKWEAVFGRTNSGFFVEVGAYDGDSYSNTSCLADVGWSGLYIEPIREFADRCRARHAGNSGVNVIETAVSDCAGTAEIYVGDTLTTLVEEQVADYEAIDWAKGFHKGERRMILTATLDELLVANGVSKGFDLLVVDVEGAEDRVLQGFALRQWAPKALLIELEDVHPDFANNVRVVHSVRAIRKMIGDAGYTVFFKDHINSLYVRNDVLAARLLLTCGSDIETRDRTLSGGVPNEDADGWSRSKANLIASFRAHHHLRDQQRLQEHLASLGLDIAGRSVLELGAGIGDRTGFFIDRDCSICVSDARPDLYAVLRDRYHWMRTELLDPEKPSDAFQDAYEIVYAYGLSYHLDDPEPALNTIARWCSSLLLLEIGVAPPGKSGIGLGERQEVDAQVSADAKRRPTRAWIFDHLKSLFPFVYATRTQPWHPEYPLDWGAPQKMAATRAVFVASRISLALPTLSTELPDIQERH